MPYSSRPNSFMRHKISGVTPEKVRLVDIDMPPMLGAAHELFGSRGSSRVAALQVVEEAADLPHRGLACPARQQPRPAGHQDDRAGEQERRPEHTWYEETDHAGGNQHPPGLFRQLFPACCDRRIRSRLVAGALG